MNASRNRTTGWLKVVLGLVFCTGLLAFNTGCLEQYFGFEPGAHNFPGTRSPTVNPAGDGVWDDLPLSSHSSSSSRGTTSTWDYDSLWTQTRRGNYR